MLKANAGKSNKTGAKWLQFYRIKLDVLSPNDVEISFHQNTNIRNSPTQLAFQAEQDLPSKNQAVSNQVLDYHKVEE